MTDETIDAIKRVCEMLIKEAGMTVDEFFKTPWYHGAYIGKDKLLKLAKLCTPFSGETKAFCSSLCIPYLRFHLEVQNLRRETFRLDELGAPTVDAWNNLLSTLRSEFPANLRQ